MNNKGQSLVMFVLTLPICLLIITIIVDIGRMYNVKVKLDNINQLAINYALKDNIINKEQFIEEFLNYNISKTSNKIKYENDIVKVNITYNYKGIFLNKIYPIKSNYSGYIDNNKIIIEKE